MMMLSPRAHLQRGHRQESLTRTTYRLTSTAAIPIYAKIVDFATKTPANTTGAFYYDARDAVGVALSNITQTGADVDSELQTAQETLEFTMGA